MSKIISDMKGLKSVMLLVPLIYFGLVLFSIVIAEEPRTIFYYNEMIMFPLIVMFTGLFFQREFGGEMVEIYATFPISLPGMLFRKLLLLMILTFVLHLGWTLVYLAKFETMATMVYTYDGRDAVYSQIAILPLYMQAFPAYLLITSVTVIALVLSKRLYVGWLTGFAVWMFFSLMGNEWSGVFSLYTIYTERPFLHNQLIMSCLAIVMVIIAAILINQRSHWIAKEED